MPTNPPIPPTPDDPMASPEDFGDSAGGEATLSTNPNLAPKAPVAVPLMGASEVPRTVEAEPGTPLPPDAGPGQSNKPGFRPGPMPGDRVAR